MCEMCDKAIELGIEMSKSFDSALVETNCYFCSKAIKTKRINTYCGEVFCSGVCEKKEEKRFNNLPLST